MSLIAISCGGADSKPNATNTIKLGANVPLTGACASLSTSYLNNINLAVKELNASGGLLGGRKLEVVVRDSRTDPSIAGANTTELVTEFDVAAMVGPICSSECLGAVAAVKQHGLPTIVSGSNPSITDADDGDFMFRHFPSDAFQGPKLALLAKARGWLRGAVVYENTAYGSGLYAQFKARYESSEVLGTLTAEVPYTSGAAGYGPEAAAATVGATAPDVIFFFGYPKDVSKLLLEIAASGYAGNYVGSDATQSLELLKDASGVNFKERWMATSAGVYQHPPYDRYALRYESQFGMEPEMYLSGAYDSVMALGLAIEAAGSLDRTAIRDALRVVTAGGEGLFADAIKDAVGKVTAGADVDYNGVSSIVEFDAKGDLTFESSSYVLWTFDDQGRFAYVDSI